MARLVPVVLGLLIAGAASAAPPAKTARKPAPAPAASKPGSAPARSLRKPAPPGLAPAALESFVEGVLADKAGDLETALRRYASANRPTEHANIVYNIADLERRTEQLAKAIKSYRKYLELAPRATDRAAVERLVAQLARTPGTLVVDGDELDAVVFVDGELIGPSPAVLQLPKGRYAVDRIGPTTHGHSRVDLDVLDQRHVRLHGHGDQPGNVVMNASRELGGGRWQDRGHEFAVPGRFALPPGRHATFFNRPGRTCTPIAFDVPADGSVVFVWIEATGPAKGGGCIPIEVRASKLRFPAAAKPVSR